MQKLWRGYKHRNPRMWLKKWSVPVLFSFNRSSGVRMKAPSMKDVLDMDQENVREEPEKLRITAPPPPTPSRLVDVWRVEMQDSFPIWTFTINHLNVLIHFLQRFCSAHIHSFILLCICLSFLLRHPQAESPPPHSQTNSHLLGQTHMWVSARHGDLSQWGPYSGV